MFRYLLLALVPLLGFTLEISVDIAKDDFQKYSILYISDPSKFTCEALKDDFQETKQVLCAFKKQPIRQLKRYSNEFFVFETFTKKGIFFLSVKPKHKMRLFGNIFDLTKDDAVYNAKITLSDHWFVVGYKQKMPLLKPQDDSLLALNFPIYLTEDKIPYVGSLDMKGNPVFIKKVEDVKQYIKVKEYFKEKNYDRCLEIVEEILAKYPNTLFKSELIYYKIKIYAKLNDYDNVIENSKLFLREFSSDKNIAEVLSLIAYSYGKIGMISDADYFFDRLFSEHATNKYAQMGYIYKGELSEESGGIKKAQKYYKKALYTTKDVDVAVEAAYHLAMLKLQMKPKEAIPYLEKILKVKPHYFKEHFTSSLQLIQDLASHDLYEIASKIATALLDEINPTYDEYEDVLAYKGLYLAHTKHKKEALAALNDYMKKFPSGDYYEKIERAKDQLFFDIEDINATVKLEELDRLLEEYKDPQILDKALYEKAQLLNELHRYNDVLALKEQLLALDEDKFAHVEDIIQTAAIGAMQESLEKNNCKDVLVLSNEHNVTLSNKWDDNIYKCAMKGGDFALAKSMISKNLSTKDIAQKEKWLYRFIKVNFATGNYEEVLSAAQDLVKLLEVQPNKEYEDVYRILFDTYSRLEKPDKMIEAMAKIESYFQDNYKDIDRYAQMVSVGEIKKDDNLVIKYGQKLYDIQKRTLSHAQSPFVEFALYDAYMNLQNYDKALEVIASLDSFTLNKEQRARQKYLLGNAYAKLWQDEKALKAYDEAIKADPNSAWAKLAQSAKEI